MNIAHITPTKFLDHVEGNPVHMALAHVANSDEAYAKWYRAQVEAGSTVMLDNGVEEHGKAATLGQIRLAAARTKAQEVVIPDAFRDADLTVKLFNSSLFTVGPNCDRVPWERNVVVAHGATRQQWTECFDFFNNHPEAHVICLPKVLDEIWGYGGRLGAACYISASGRVDPKKTYHLLGVWTDPLEVFLQARLNPWIRSLDTALAFHAGWQEVSLKYLSLDKDHSKPSRPHSYFDLDPLKATSLQMDLIELNLKMIDRWAEGYE